MKIITVYELLGMVKDGKLEDGTKFKYDDDYFKYWKKSNSFDRYKDKTYTTVQYYNDNLCDLTMLNDEVEILEEEKLESLIMCIDDIYPNQMSRAYIQHNFEEVAKHNFEIIHKEFNKIIDYLNSKGD